MSGDVQNVCVLVVDDEESLRRVMVRQLERAGYRCLSAGDTAVARALIEEHDIDVLITDVNMPHESGIMLLRDIHHQQLDMATLLVTGIENAELASNATKLGAYGYLIKPVSATQLQISVTNAVIRLQLERELHRDVEELEQTLEARETELALVSQKSGAVAATPSTPEGMNREGLMRTLTDLVRAGGRDPFALLIIRARRLPRLRATLTAAQLERAHEETCKAVRGALRPGDQLAVLALGEMAVVLTDPLSAADPVSAAEQVLDAVQAACITTDGADPVAVDAGVAYGDADAEMLVRRASVACFQATRANRSSGSVEVFTERTTTSLRGALGLEAELLKAADSGQIVPYFQPVVSLSDDNIVGLEIIPRWLHPERGMLHSSLFMPLASEMGLADSITLSLLRTACSSLALWNEKSFGQAPLYVGVDVSAGQLLRGQMADDLRWALEMTGVSPRHLVLEIHEHAISDRLDVLRPHLDEIRRLGVQLAVDNLGAGALSLHHLQDVSFDMVKLARILLEAAGYDADSGALLRTAIEVAHALELPVVAQGVERTRQAETLKHAGCDFGQGSYLCGPLDADAVTVLLEQRRLT